LVICSDPEALNCTPVSVGVAVPDPNKRFSVARGLELLLLMGSACHTNASFEAVLLVLLNADATRLRVWEFLPVAAVALPADGSFNAPRTIAAPLTSSFAPGFVLPMPILPVDPEPF
jgi:hypothetical protein